MEEELEILSKVIKNVGKKNLRLTKKKVPISDSRISSTVEKFKRLYKVKMTKKGSRTFVPRAIPTTPADNAITKQDSRDSNSSMENCLSASSSSQSFDSLFPTKTTSPEQNSISGQEPASLDDLDAVWKTISGDPLELEDFLNSSEFASWDVSQHH